MTQHAYGEREQQHWQRQRACDDSAGQRAVERLRPDAAQHIGRQPQQEQRGNDHRCAVAVRHGQGA